MRRKYTKRLQEKSNIMLVDPEVTDVFPNSASVNAALRALADIARRVAKRRVS